MRRLSALSGGGQDKPQPVLKMSPTGGGSSTVSSSMSRKEKDMERHLMAQIKELNRQLDAERSKHIESTETLTEDTPANRLIIVANRLPVSLTRSGDGTWSARMSSGGLVSAFLGVKDIDMIWVGWPGKEIPEDEQDSVKEQLSDIHCVPVFLKQELSDLYYNGFSNNVLWPLFHYIPLSMLDSDATMDRQQWEAYKEANHKFAETVMNHWTEGDMVWVQDYHLMLVPNILREMSSSMKIGWFLHTPFASSEIYRTLPRRKEILSGVLSADLLGFHIYDYARHFMSSCARVLGTDVSLENQYIIDNVNRRTITVDAFPIGIDPNKFEEALDSSVVKDKIIDLQRRFDGKKVLLGIDRLDYVKGIPHKLLALEKFLTMHPQWSGKIVLVQIAVPSRTEVTGYQKLRNNVHKLVGRINGTFGTLEDVPIHYLDQSVDHVDLCALYFRADVMVVTSLRDGMNLVSFEYIACQKRNHGVLILSEFAGAAQALGAGALMVNPFNTNELANAMGEALNMSRNEREERHQYMFNYVNTHTAQAWADNFVVMLRYQEVLAADDTDPFAGTQDTILLPNPNVLRAYRASSKRLVVLGMLGTLIDYTRFTNMAELPSDVRHSLAVLAADPNTTLLVVSGRERALVNEWLADLPCWLVAENGLFYRPPPEPHELGADSSWECGSENLDDSWMENLKPVFQYFEERTPDTFTEVQEYTMTWHFKVNADEDFGEMQAGNLRDHLVKVAGNVPVEVNLDNNRVEVRPYGVSKGATVESILERLQGDDTKFDFVLCVADLNARDEDLFSALEAAVDEDKKSQLFLTCVGPAKASQALYHLPDCDAVPSMLESLAEVSTQLEAPDADEVPESSLVMKQLPAVASQLRGKHATFFLDNIDAEVYHTALERITNVFSTAFIKRTMDAENDTSAIYGVDIMGSGGTATDVTELKVADSYRPALESAHSQLESLLGDVNDIQIEDKRFSVSVTYRGISEDEVQRVEHAVDTTLADLPMLRKVEGRMMMELRPEVEWNKAKAVEWIVDAVKKQLEISEIMPVYIGDDGAFSVLNSIGGLSILLPAPDGSMQVPLQQLETTSLQLAGPEELGPLLNWFANQMARPAHSGVFAHTNGKLPEQTPSTRPGAKAKIPMSMSLESLTSLKPNTMDPQWSLERIDSLALGVGEQIHNTNDRKTSHPHRSNGARSRSID